MSATTGVRGGRPDRLALAWGRVTTRVLDGWISFATVMTYVFLFTPIVILVAFSFNKAPTSYQWTGATLDWYAKLASDRNLQSALTVSLIVGVASSALATSLGIITALALRRPFRGKTLLSMGLLLPLVLPEIVIALAFLAFMVSAGVRLGYPTLIAGHTLLTLPFATLILGSAVGGLDPGVEEAAADLGCSPLGVFRKVTFPLLLPGVVTSGLLCFSVSFDDIAMSIFASGVGTTTLPLRIYSMLKTGITPEINALGTVLVALNLLAVVAIGVRQLRGVLSGAPRRQEGA